MGSGVGARRGGNAGRASEVANVPAPTTPQPNSTTPEPTAASLEPNNTGALPEPVLTQPEPKPQTGENYQVPGNYPNMIHLVNPNSESAAGYRAAFGPGDAPVVSMVRGSQDRIQEIFGHNLSEQDIAALVGAPNDSRVSVFPSYGGKLTISVDHPLIERQERTISLNNRDQIVVHNDLFRVDEFAPKGFGAAVFAQQVAQARRLGVTKIVTDAAGGPGDEQYNGYYTWARFGYNGEIRYSTWQRMPANLRSDTTTELMQKPGGAAWWKDHGHQFEGTFDLSPKSDSSRVLRYYLQERGMRSG